MSVRETALAALKATLAAALPLARVRRAEPLPDRYDPGGDVRIGDGDPGQPEVTLSPLVYTFRHAVPVVAVAQHATAATRAAMLDALLTTIGAAIAADRTLGGVVIWADVSAPEMDAEGHIGATSVGTATIIVTLVYDVPGNALA